MWTLLFLCSVIISHAVQATDGRWYTTEEPSCRWNCGYDIGSCSCSSSCEWRGDCCNDYYSYCWTTTHWPVYTTEEPSCTTWDCGHDLGSCSCSSSCEWRGNCCNNYYSYCWTTTHWPWYPTGRTTTQYPTEYPTTEEPSCTRYNCGYDLGSCSCASSCEWRGNCCKYYYSYCWTTTHWPWYTTDEPTTNHWPWDTTEEPSCRWNCGRNMGSCSCSSSCEWRGDCCNDYYSYCWTTTHWPWDTTEYPTTEEPSCTRYNCGYDLGSCSCASSCEWRGNCCKYYYSYCWTTTHWPWYPTDEPTTTDWPWDTTEPSCRWNCGYDLGSCSCSSSCEWRGNCCKDYYSFCWTPTAWPTTTYWPWSPTAKPCESTLYYSGTFTSPNHPSNYEDHTYCVWYLYSTYNHRISLTFKFLELENCCDCDYIEIYDGSYVGSRYLGKVCHGNQTTFQSSSRYMTVVFRTDLSVTARGFSAEFRSSDSDWPATTYWPWYTTEEPSCRWNCGRNMGSCSCSSSCEWRGDCCHDYYSYCWTTTTYWPWHTQEEPSTYWPWYTSETPCETSLYYSGTINSPNYPNNYDDHTYCVWYLHTSYDHNIILSFTFLDFEDCCNCDYIEIYDGSYVGSQYLGKVCHGNQTTFQSSSRYMTVVFRTDSSMTASGFNAIFRSSEPVPCEKYLFGSGTITSPDHPNYYDDHTYCVWYLETTDDHRIFLSFTYLQLENCCECDYIAIYDGSYVGAPSLGIVCNSSLSTFQSSSKFMTVVFRTDSSVVARGFSADFRSVLSPQSGQVSCSSENMTIAIDHYYLSSLGLNANSVYLNDPDCRPSNIYSQVVFNYPILSCGNIREIESGRVLYTNTIRAYTTRQGEITRQSYFALNVECRMEEDSKAQIMYLIQPLGNSSLIGTGRFSISMAFYTSNYFYHKVTEYPYRVTLNQDLFVQIELMDYGGGLNTIIDNCVTSTSPDDFETRPYYLIRNGCPLDGTCSIYNAPPGKARFTFKAFQFLRGTESVYIQCQVQICEAGDESSRCNPKCNRRKARDVGSEHDSRTLVLGPIQFKEPEKEEENQEEKA